MGRGRTTSTHAENLVGGVITLAGQIPHSAWQACYRALDRAHHYLLFNVIKSPLLTLKSEVVKVGSLVILFSQDIDVIVLFDKKSRGNASLHRAYFTVA